MRLLFAKRPSRPVPASTCKIAAEPPRQEAVVCEPGRRKGQGSFACLADTDGDGAFDHFGSVNAKSYGYGSSTQIGFLVGMVKIDGWTGNGNARHRLAIARRCLA
ncbi:MAG: hypothetical protein R3E18_09780 [Sphingomonadaceae bacterium]